MSSTNRGYNRHKSDYYVTPIKPIKEFLEEFFMQEDICSLNKFCWLDPCAGGDAENKMSYPEVIKDLPECRQIITADIRDDSLAEHKLDYLSIGELWEGLADIIITNPPFYAALPIIKKALDDVRDGGYVIMLLRLNFWGSKERNQWLKDNMPKYCFIHGFPRMSFTKNGGTDSIEYAHFVWKKGEKNEYTKIILL